MFCLERRSMPIKATILAVLLVLVTVGCASSSGGLGGAAGACAAPEFGIITDENFQVVDIVPHSAASKAGMQVGDVLVDMTWVKMEAQPACNDTLELDANGSPLITFSALPIPALVVEPEHPEGAVPFANQDRIRSMIGYGATMMFRLERGDREIELTIRPEGLGARPYTPGDPTATPIPSTPMHYYY
jgi:hypothetical protein